MRVSDVLHPGRLLRWQPATSLLAGLLVATSLFAESPQSAPTVTADFFVSLPADGSPVSLASSAGAQWEILPPGVEPDLEAAPPVYPNAQTVETPGDLFLQGLRIQERGENTFWYRLVFDLEREPDGNMALRMGEISDRDRVYLNGYAVGQTGEWDAERPQAYDRVRVYPVPHEWLRTGQNVLYVQVQNYFSTEYGIYRDEILLGPANRIWRDYYLDNTYQAFALIAYLTFALYFLLFYLRRRSDRENLFFALFLLSLVVYSFLHTQFKYILGFELYQLKRIQTIAVFTTVPLFYQFIRSYYRLRPANSERFVRNFDRLMWLVHLVPITGTAIVLWSPSTEVWQAVINSLVQPGWLAYICATLFIMIQWAVRRSDDRRRRDAILMLGACVLLLVALVLDILSGRAIVNLPPLLTYAFVLFVVSMALVLANRFVRLQNEMTRLNADLARFNEATSRFVPFELLTLLERDSILEVNLGDQVQKEMTVLFSDIRSFTALSEQMTPPENFAFLNSYLRRMGPVIREHKGFIDKYIGDAIMALFASSADDAFEAALDMYRTLASWNISRERHGLPPVEIGVGINRGRLMVGTIGENQRMEGTVISDAVNLASRIESLTGLYGASVLTGDATRNALENPERFAFRRLDRVQVKGKREVIDLLEFLDVLPAAERDRRLANAVAYETALDLYLAGNFEQAGLAFRSQVANDPGDRAAALFVRRCERLQATPELEWDGATILKNK